MPYALSPSHIMTLRVCRRPESRPLAPARTGSRASLSVPPGPHASPCLPLLGSEAKLQGELDEVDRRMGASLSQKRSRKEVLINGGERHMALHVPLRLHRE